MSTCQSFLGTAFQASEHSLGFVYGNTAGRYTVYIGGDSGYGKHYREIAQRYSTIDYAILENGQYNEDWRYIHTLPVQQDSVIRDLGAKTYCQSTTPNSPWPAIRGMSPLTKSEKPQLPTPPSI